VNLLSFYSTLCWKFPFNYFVHSLCYLKIANLAATCRKLH
jgi:hypothetical protein